MFDFLEIYFKENKEMTQWKLGFLRAGKHSSFPILTLSIQETDMTLLKDLSEQQQQNHHQQQEQHKWNMYGSFLFQRSFPQTYKFP